MSCREHCRVPRFWADAEEDIGHLVHRPGGCWAFRNDLSGDEDGGLHTFQAVAVTES